MSTNQRSLLTNQAITRTREHIVRIGALLFDRRLTDAGGGNISVRVDDLVCITRRYSGSKNQWQLTPEQVLVADLDGNVLDGEGQISRETKVHLKLHREFGEMGTAVIHCHARNVMVFAATARSMPPVLEGTRKFGEIHVADYAPAHSADLSEHIAAVIRGQEARIRNHAAAAIAPWHGLFVMGKDLDATFDAVERLDTNAYCILMGQLLSQSDLLARQRESMEQAIAIYKD